ncbi:DUF547 domain-containing protein [Flavilitoribacter nigricans]|uniref:DUF547 domain-containing protein n=1 Tax=Flavilitoribacter nigricans (strain ATCC 23147 / DSM 23189 / NBRC 102662 / NCIMB 1420 / SS-2) TaxID=1122177 RepID=A0A2D0NJ35_FLAN2|nr:DUF547 domain-containing protein [Flavilitoribacter nigricans]PHN08515.1 hypothetical protein CRP01_00975 [Flavilitoribacter nigricans DSM 23189 = NBRC 102662]
MRFLIVALLCVYLFQLTACGGNADHRQTAEVEPDDIVSTAVSPAPETAAAEQPETAETVEATSTPSDTQAKPVKISQKRQLNEAPKTPKADDAAVKAADEQKASTTESVEPAATPAETPKQPEEPEATVAEKAATEQSDTAEPGPVEKPAPVKATGADHSQWDALLKQYVSATGKVNYAGFKQDKTKLQAYLDELAANPVQDSWSRTEKMAYWINVYNAFTIKLIVDNYPVTSITKLHNGKPWDVKWIKLGSKTYSLNEVENDILRPKYKDARIHFAVNCAAKSCPPLLNRAWTKDNLETYLDKQTKAFINNSKYNTLSARKAEVSKIFEWYAADFGQLIEFLNKYSETRINNGATVNYKEYDWALNN